VQITGLLVSVVGYAFAIVYVRDFNGHFNHVHSYVGMVLLGMAWVCL
jgi:hypothetical protein